MRILIIGCGSIGTNLAFTADSLPEVSKIYVFDSKPQMAEKLAEKTEKGMAVESVEEELYHSDLVIEAASQEAAKVYLPMVVERGVNIMVMSVGALVEDDFRSAILEKAAETEARIYIPSGAVCGVDGLRSAIEAGVNHVELISTKGPKSIEGVQYVLDKGIVVDDLTERTEVYYGPAREAVKLFPKNINVAATVSLFGIGFDETKVRVIVDPKAIHNSHELIYSGDFGQAVCHTYNIPSPDNPRTSHLSALSASHALRSLVKNVWIAL